MSGAADAQRALVRALADVPMPRRAAVDALAQAVAAFGEEVDVIRDALDRASAANSIEALMSATVGLIVAADDLAARASGVHAATAALRDEVLGAGTVARAGLAAAFAATGAPHAETATHRAHLLPPSTRVVTGPGVPPEYWRERPPAPDRRKLRAALERHDRVPGAVLVPNLPAVRIDNRK